MLHAAAVKFFDQVAEIAEEEGHHPDLHLTNYREVQVPKYTVGKVQCRKAPPDVHMFAGGIGHTCNRGLVNV